MVCLALAGFATLPGHTQIFVLKEDADGPFSCGKGGLSSSWQDCGTGYSDYVFLGTVETVEPLQKKELLLQVRPDEVFHGTPPATLQIKTRQVRCGTPIHPGDQWLFYLDRTKDGIPILDPFAGGSMPLSQARSRLAILRQLHQQPELAILQGAIRQGDPFANPTNIPDAIVTAAPTNGAAITTKTDADGEFNFQAVPAADYLLTAEGPHGYRPDDERVVLHSGQCLHITMSRSSHASLSGYVRRTSGQAVADANLTLASAKTGMRYYIRTGLDGSFHFLHLQPGSYFLGANPPGMPSPEYDTQSKFIATAYYGGTTSMDGATVITIHPEEALENITLSLPEH